MSNYVKLQSHKHIDFVHLITAVWKLSICLLCEKLFLPHHNNTMSLFQHFDLLLSESAAEGAT